MFESVINIEEIGVMLEKVFSRKKVHPAFQPNGAGKFLPSGGEIHYLYWYMQGSIMVPCIRDQLRKAWGFCERHAWAAILVEVSFRHGYLHGPAILYSELMSQSLPAFRLRGPGKGLRFQKYFREKAACIMCEMRLGP